MAEQTPHPEAFTTGPPPVTEKKPGQLTPEQIKQFYQDVSITGQLTPEQITQFYQDVIITGQLTPE